MAVAEGSSAAWRRGSVVGQGGLYRARSWLRVAAHPVAASDARPQRRDRGHRRFCWGAARAARSCAALFEARACRSRSRTTAPCRAGEEDDVTHVLGYVWLGSAGEQSGQGRRNLPASSPVKDIVMKMDRAAVAAAPTACHCCSDEAVAQSSSSSSEMSCSGSRHSICAMDRSIAGGWSSLDHLGRCPGRDGCSLSSAKRACTHQSTIINGVIRTHG